MTHRMLRSETRRSSASSASAKPGRRSPSGLREAGVDGMSAWDILFPERGRR